MFKRIRESDWYIKFKELWANPKTHAMIVLAFWLIFMVVAIVLVRVTTNTSVPTQKIEKEATSFANVQNYDFTYKTNDLEINGSYYDDATIFYLNNKRYYAKDNVYLIDDKYLFTGDTIWFGADGGYSFISALAESNKLAVRSLGILEQKLKKMCVKPLFITGHTGFTDNFEFAFAHKEKLCSPFKKKVHDPSAPYDAYDESDDTERNAKNGFLKVAWK